MMEKTLIDSLMTVPELHNGEYLVQDEYSLRFKALADTFTAVPAQYPTIRRALAEESIRRALRMIYRYWTVDGDTFEDWSFYMDKMYEECSALVNNMLSEDFAKDLCVEVTEDLMRRICFLVFGCQGHTSYDFDEINTYLLSCCDEFGHPYSCFINVASLESMLNLYPDEFLPEYDTFLGQLWVPLGGLPQHHVRFLLMKAEHVAQVKWTDLFSSFERCKSFINAVAGQMDRNTLRVVRRMYLTNTRRSDVNPPVDVEKLQKDAETADQSLRTRIIMLMDWLFSHQSLTEKYRQLHEEYDNLKKQLSISQAQRAVDGQERDEQAKKDCEAIDFISKCQDEYDLAMRNLSDVTLENNNLNEQVRNLQAQLDQANATIADQKETIAAKKASDKVKVAQDQAEDARLKYKQLQDAFDQKVTEEVVKNRDGNIKLFLDGLRQRCKNKSPEKIGFLFDDLKDSSWGFPELQKAVRELHAELIAEPTQEERRTRAMERQADKGPAPTIQNTFPECKTFVNRPNIDSPEVAKALVGGQTDEPKKLTE